MEQFYIPRREAFRSLCVVSICVNFCTFRVIMLDERIFKLCSHLRQHITFMWSLWSSSWVGKKLQVDLWTIFSFFTWTLANRFELSYHPVYHVNLLYKHCLYCNAYLFSVSESFCGVKRCGFGLNIMNISTVKNLASKYALYLLYCAQLNVSICLVWCLFESRSILSARWRPSSCHVNL